MAEEQTFELLKTEFRRVGVDPDTFSAMLALRPEDALRALRSLPDGAGPAAFLGRLRSGGVAQPTSGSNDAGSLAKRGQRRRNRSA